MALIACTECSKEISDTALTCPQCGAPTAAAKTEAKKARGNVQGVGCLTMLIGAGVCFLQPLVGIIAAAIGLVILIYGLFKQ